MNILFAYALFQNIGGVSLSEVEYLKRIHNHLIVQDYEAACQECSEAVNIYPLSKEIHEKWVISLARAGREGESLKAWQTYKDADPLDEKSTALLVEELAWGTIHKTAVSDSPQLRLMAIIAAFFSQDAKGISVVRDGLRDPNTIVRAASVRLSGRLHDEILKEEIERLIREEKNWKVRLEAIKVAGMMKIERSKPALIAFATNPSFHAEERAAAIASLVSMQKTISRKELTKLVDSDRVGLRLLACQIVAHLDLKEDTDLLSPLLFDYNADVRAAALYTIGILRIPINLEKGSVIKLLHDPSPSVAITAAWVVGLSDSELGQTAMRKWIEDPGETNRRLASGALVALGVHGIPLMEIIFRQTQDPYVKLNLALGLIGQRCCINEAADTVFTQLSSLKDQWMKEESDGFSRIVPSTVQHESIIPNAPEAVNQKTRLELLNLLAVVGYPKAIDAVKLFLQQKKWGIASMASAVLLTEGDEPAIEVVSRLLVDPDPSMRLEAALVLALWGEGEDALDVLEKAYPTARFEEKEKILEGIGNIGSKKSLPFLLDRLAETHPSLRLIAAAGVVKILYN